MKSLEEDAKPKPHKIFSQQFIEPNKISKSSTTRQTTTKKIITPTHLTTQTKVFERLKPTQSKLIRNFQKQLNLSQPGHLGTAVELAKLLPQNIQFLVDEGYSKYKINEFVSNLVPLDRELPDVRLNS